MDSVKNPNILSIMTGQDERLLDHLIPLSLLLQIPCLITEEKNYLLCKKYYPKAISYLVPNEELSFFTLAKKYDLFIQSTFWDRTFTSYIKSFFPHVRFAYCPHGNSDKGHQKPMMAGIEEQDLFFLYGTHMQKKLQDQRLWGKSPPHVPIGNYRLAYYLKNKKFYDDLVAKEIFSQLPVNNLTILYAPTWNDEENSTSFFLECRRLISQLPKHINLIIKPHPLLEEMSPTKYYQTLPENIGQKNLLVLREYPLIFPILSKIDILLIDFSSIGYDFLSFTKPMFFFNSHNLVNKKSTFLHKCGYTLPSQGDLFRFIESHLQKKFIAKQRKINNLTYFPARKRKELLEDIQSIFCGGRTKTVETSSRL